jgi:hypothetical protein
MTHQKAMDGALTETAQSGAVTDLVDTVNREPLGEGTAPLFEGTFREIVEPEVGRFVKAEDTHGQRRSEDNSGMGG